MAVVSPELSFNPYLKNAFSSVNFDISHKTAADDKEKAGGVDRGASIDVHKSMVSQSSPSKEWELEVRVQTSSHKWLQTHGLRKQRLQMTQILEAIGFKLCEDYDPGLKRPLGSKYGVYEQITAEEGKTFNISCDRDKLLQLRKRLMQAVSLYKCRLEWLTSDSRRLFGVVEEKAVTVVMDIRNMSPEQFDQYRAALDQVMREQFHHITKFNLIRASEDMELFSAECMPCSYGTVESAIQWMWALDRLAPVSNTACAEAVLRALLDRHNEAVYLFTEGTSIDCGRELIIEKVRDVEPKIPIHVVSFNCNSADTVKFLRNFATLTGGRFHAYAVLTETDVFDPEPIIPTTDPFSASQANILLKRKTFGGLAPGAGVRPDVVLLFEEIEEARNNLQQLEVLIDRSPAPPSKALTVAEQVKAEQAAVEAKEEQYMSSKQWLEVYGIDARKMGLAEVLSSVAFRHQDGVVGLLEKPTNQQTDAVSQDKLINAKYCHNFPVLRWKDDRVVHVHVTPEVHRQYEQRMAVLLKAIQQRVDWLQHGSRALFGTVVEDDIYILIDASASMQHSMQFVKERLLVLMQEQLRHKSQFNLAAFNSKVNCWRDRLTSVSEGALQSAWKWVQGLTCWGSTNTYAALQTALADSRTQAVYLLTDGRPDQMSKTILTQVQMAKRVPVHTISFNCHDNDANQFLHDLAHATGGRYHCYTPHGKSHHVADTWQSEDIKLLEDELGRGLEYLDRMAELRDQCAAMAWKTEIDALKNEPKALLPPPLSSRPTSAPPSRSPMRPSSAVALRPSRPQGAPRRPQSARGHRGRKLVAGKSATGQRSRHSKGHTRTSLMRTRTSSGRFTPSEWLLPETAELFEQQTERQRHLAQLLASLGLAPSVKPLEKDVSEQTTKLQKRKHKGAKSPLSPKQWLKRHGLVARRLTIMDALAPTLVPHRSSYVPVLDKRVVARVFNEVLPIAHVSGRQGHRITLVNPGAVNLTDYENKLDKAIAAYRQRLDALVWKALPDSVKDEFESKEPVSFEDNRAKFLQALEENDWPISESDIRALEKEIARGQKFLQQSKDLRQAAVAKGDNADSISDTASVVSSKASSVKESAKEEEEEEEEEDVSESVDKVLQVKDNDILTVPTTPRVGSETHTPTPHPPDTPRSGKDTPLTNTPRSPRIRTPRSQNTTATSLTPRPPHHHHPSTPRSAAGGGTPRRIREHQNRGGRPVGKGDPKVVAKEERKGRGRVMVSMFRGTRVIARNHADGLYYPGKVIKCPTARRAIVEFSEGPRDVLTRFILPVGGAVACPPLSVGDYALVQVINMTLSTECYVPCIVQFIPQRAQTQHQFYTVMLYNGQKVTTRRSHLVKISKERFELSARYITDVQGEDRKQLEKDVYVSERRKTEEDKLRRKSDERQKPRRRSRSPSSESDSRSRSRTPSKSRSRSRSSSRSKSKSRSRSPSPPTTRPRSPTPGEGLVDGESPKPARSRVRPSSSRRRDKMKIVGKHDEDRYQSSREKIQTRSRSRSESESPSRHDNTPRRKPSRSSSRSRSRSRSASSSSSAGRKSKSKSEKKAERKKKRRARSDSRSSDGSKSLVVVVREEEEKRRSRSRSGSGSRSGSSSRSESPVSERQKELGRLKKQLKEQHRQQAKERKKLKRKMKEMSKVQTQLLKRILDENKEEEEQKKEDKKQEPEEEEAPVVTPRLLRLRRSLPELKTSEEVLARFSDDGWYYRGTVQQNLGDQSYIVEDATGYMERIWREDVISDYDDNAPPLKANDRVVAQHPQHSGSYAPGSVLSFDDVLQMVAVQFYDGTEGQVPLVEVYRLVLEKYHSDVLHIQQRQRGMLGLSVVARDDESGQYFPGQIVDVKDGGVTYVVRWSHGAQSEQLPVHIFSAVTRRPRLLIGDRVLAVADPEQVLFLPGQIIGAQERGMVVRFCDGQVRDDVSPLFSYWLSPGYCEEASYFWKIHQPHAGKRIMSHA